MPVFWRWRERQVGRCRRRIRRTDGKQVLQDIRGIDHGRHPGGGCRVRRAVVVGNRIDHVRTQPPQSH